LVDDDDAVRNALALLLEVSGFRVESYAGGESFLAACGSLRHPCCLVLDVRMPGMSGPALHQELGRRGIRVPIIFLTAHGDIPTTVAAIKAGAIDFLTKPVEGSLLVERVRAALESDAQQQTQLQEINALRGRYAMLTERERKVLALVVAGRSSKEIARVLDISHRTVETHRTHIMQKMSARSAVDLATMGQALGLNGTEVHHT
jgi:FixJ family two-component response regulator